MRHIFAFEIETEIRWAPRPMGLSPRVLFWSMRRCAMVVTYVTNLSIECRSRVAYRLERCQECPPRPASAPSPFPNNRLLADGGFPTADACHFGLNHVRIHVAFR